MKKNVLALLVIVIICQSVLAQAPSGVIYKTSTTPVIDGNIDDIWGSAVKYNIDKKYGNEVPSLGETGTNYWKSLWDDNGIYILVVVNDDNWYPYYILDAADRWNYDGVEVYFDANSVLKDGGGYGGGLMCGGHHMFSPGPDEGKINGNMQIVDYATEYGTLFKVKYAYKVSEPKYNAEFFIPWEGIPDKTRALFDKSGTMGFDVYVKDRDPGDSYRKRAVWANVGAINENFFTMDDAGTLTFEELVKIDGGSDKTVVYNETIQLSASTNFVNPGTLTYSWSPSEGLSQTDIPNPIVTATKDITYNLTVTNSDGTIGKATVSIIVNSLEADASDQTISCGNTTQLDVSTNYTGTGTLTYDWQPKDKLDNSMIKNPIATLTQDTDFTVTVTTPNGAVAQKSVHVDVSGINYQPELCLVSVDANNKNVLVWSQPEGTAIQDYLIFRESLIQTDFYDLIGSVASGSEPVYTDLSSNALVQSNKYKIAARDNCGFVTSQSIPHKTIHLSINKGQGNSWNLIWESYTGFSVSSYKIYRGSTLENLTLIGSTSGSANSYSDFTANDGDVFYQIEVLTPSPCNSLKSTAFSSTKSNIASNNFTISSPALTLEASGIFPVPVKDKLYINRDLSCISEMVVLSIDGRVELSFKQPFTDGNINVGSLSRGIYLLKISDSEGISVQKFLKE
jgi:hypothetical protein